MAIKSVQQIIGFLRHSLGLVLKTKLCLITEAFLSFDSGPWENNKQISSLIPDVEVVVL